MRRAKRAPGLTFRFVPQQLHQRALALATQGLAGRYGDPGQVLRQATEIGLRAQEAVVSPLGGAMPGVVRICREGGATVPAERMDGPSLCAVCGLGKLSRHAFTECSEFRPNVEPRPFALAPVPTDAPASIREIAAEVQEGGGAAGILRLPSLRRKRCRNDDCGHSGAKHSLGSCNFWSSAGTRCQCKAFVVAAARRVPKAPDASAVRYADAYSRGIRDAAPGETWALSPADARGIGATIGPALAAHARDTQGSPIVGELLLTWLWDAARVFRRETAGKAEFWGGWAPRHFARWLNQRTKSPKGTAQPAPTRRLGREAQ